MLLSSNPWGWLKNGSDSSRRDFYPISFSSMLVDLGENPDGKGRVCLREYGEALQNHQMSKRTTLRHSFPSMGNKCEPWFSVAGSSFLSRGGYIYSKRTSDCWMIVRTRNSNELPVSWEKDVPGRAQMACLNEKADYAKRLVCVRAPLIDLWVLAMRELAMNIDLWVGCQRAGAEEEFITLWRTWKIKATWNTHPI